jgi:murein DD-endopeptidase MepM/ murein hydrolase activator NlpD
MKQPLPRIDWRAIGARPFEFIVLDPRSGRDHRVRITQRAVAAGLAAIACSLVLVGWSVRYFSGDYVDAELAASWRERLDGQQEELERIRRESDATLGAFTRRFGDLQARLVSMESMGERIASSAGIGQEFDLDEPLAIGGPEPTSDEEIPLRPPAFVSMIDDLSEQVLERQQQLTALERLLDLREYEEASAVAGRPVGWGWLSSPYGRRVDPIHGRLAYHKGIDFAGRAGDPVLAVATGIVTFAGERGGYGWLVEITHGNGYVTRYAHCAEVTVEVGELVRKGESVGTIGSTGRSTGPHVHFEVLRGGRQIDPTRFVTRAAG